MSEFKLTGDFYVSEWNGSSLNDGTDPDTPFSHPADLPTGTSDLRAICSGYFEGAGHQPKFYTGDGICIFNLLGGTASIRRASGLSHFNIHYKNGTLVGSGSSGTSFLHTNCIFENVNLGNATSYNLFNCVFLTNLTATNNISQIANSLCFGDISGLAFGNFNYSFLQAGKKIVYTGGSAGLNNNCINGIITISGVDYELKKLIDGSTRPDANPAIPDLATASGFSDTYTTRGNFAGDAKILDALSRIVEPDSDLLKKSNASGYIGGVKPGRSIVKGDSDSDLTITTSQIDTSNPSNWTIGAGYDEGYIFITFKLSDNIVQVPKIHMDALLAFDSSEVGGTSGNNNVPDFFPTLYTPLSQAGLKPNRLTYGLRTSQQVSKPTSESQWDNDSVALGTDVARYYVQEWSAQPKIYDVLGVTYGSGNPESVGVSGNTINARWCQVQIRLTNRREQ